MKSVIDAEQFAGLFLEHHDRLHRFARQLVGNSADADDLVQQAFLKVHHYLCNGNTIRAPLSFLFVTVRNLVNDDYRQKKIELIDSTIDVDELVPKGGTPSIERQVVSELEFEEFCAAVTQLPGRMRDATVEALSEEERECLQGLALGKTSLDIGMTLNISEITVNLHIENALKKLNANSRILAVVVAIYKEFISLRDMGVSLVDDIP